ncbi:MAG: hypothetical protein AAF693_17795 [Bacteroidota bacterium]
MKSVRPLLLCLAFIFGACDKCDECVSEFDFQFQFTDANDNEIFTDLSQLQVIDLRDTPFEADRIVQDGDTVYTVALLYEDPLASPPDTILLNYNNAIVDTLAVDISFSNDNDCCNNVLSIGSVRFFNRKSSRLVRSSGKVYNILIE